MSLLDELYSVKVEQSLTFISFPFPLSARPGCHWFSGISSAVICFLLFSSSSFFTSFQVGRMKMDTMIWWERNENGKIKQRKKNPTLSG